MLHPIRRRRSRLFDAALEKAIAGIIVNLIDAGGLGKTGFLPADIALHGGRRQTDRQRKHGPEGNILPMTPRRDQFKMRVACLVALLPMSANAAIRLVMLLAA